MDGIDKMVEKGEFEDVKDMREMQKLNEVEEVDATGEGVENCDEMEVDGLEE